MASASRESTPLTAMSSGMSEGRIDDAFLKPPPAPRGARIGLLGGSFDPPHRGHVHISLEALKRLQLDQVWWLVSPGNPLKSRGPWPLVQRLQQCTDLVDHPKIRITAFEAARGAPWTIETLRFLTRRFPATRFVWLMGADNLAGIHLWRDWQNIFATLPIAVMDRPGQRHRAGASPAAHRFASSRMGERSACLLAASKPPAWTLLSVPLSHASSTGIRQKYRV